MTRSFTVVALGLAASLMAASAAAQTAPTTPPPTTSSGIACGEHTALVEALGARYKEQQVSIGLQNNGQLLEVYASAQTGSWTVLSTHADGTSCILAVGRHFEQRDLPESDTPAARTEAAG